MSKQRCVYLDEDIYTFIKIHKYPLSWFINQALRKYLAEFHSKEFLNDRER